MKCYREIKFKSIDSTSAYLLRRRFALNNFTFCTAKYQTAGRGREDRKWESEKGKNLLFSVLIKGELCSKYSLLSVASATSVIIALKKFGIDDLTYKFPNDVYLGGEKVCGILLESISDGGSIDSLVVGFGLNVNQDVFPEMEGRTPTSLKAYKGKKISIKKLKKVLFNTVHSEFNKLLSGDNSFINVARNYSYLTGKKVFAEIDGKRVQVLVKGISGDGSLLVNDGQKDTPIYYGEISFHKDGKM